MAIGVAILKKQKNGKLDLIYMKDFSAERQVELDVELEVGEYIILPRTSGCSLKRPPAAKSQYLQLIDANGNMNSLGEIVIKDIFSRLDKVTINNVLEYKEFQDFY